MTRAQCLLPLPVKAMYHSNGLTQYSDRRLRFTNLRLPIGHINAAVMNLATKQVGVPNSFAASDIYTSAASPVVRPRPTSRHAHVLRRSEAGVPRGHTFRFTSSCRCASAVVRLQTAASGAATANGQIRNTMLARSWDPTTYNGLNDAADAIPALRSSAETAAATSAPQSTHHRHSGTALVPGGCFTLSVCAALQLSLPQMLLLLVRRQVLLLLLLAATFRAVARPAAQWTAGGGQRTSRAPPARGRPRDVSVPPSAAQAAHPRLMLRCPGCRLQSQAFAILIPFNPNRLT